MATLKLKGKPAQQHAKTVVNDELDAYALARWGGVAIDLYVAFAEYVPLRERWLRMEEWLNEHGDDPRVPDRRRQANDLHARLLAPGGSFDQIDRIIFRLRKSHAQLSDTARASLAADYGVELVTPDFDFFLTRMLEDQPADFPAFVDCWAVAMGGHPHPRKESEPCPF